MQKTIMGQNITPDMSGSVTMSVRCFAVADHDALLNIGCD